MPVVVVGSTNACKVSAVVETLRASFPRFADASADGFKASSGVAEQPRSMDETLRGARNRARGAFASRDAVDLAFGIESGVFELDGVMFDICAAVAYDGVRESVGWSSAFELPPAVAAHVHDGMDLTQASNAAGVSGDAKLGEGQGLIGVLSEGRVDRLAYTKQAIAVAMIGVGNPLYPPRP
ncbi:hypothetical protein KFE25_000577 [Diacronema lutheri]|uniref:inosine/xanthosine triphosphatase n=1 Tax=Diacronema lutheri TaxID=2081491 RepID=A0A8J5XEG8_DIALT|nr:hypothetical protein KFE25_000577 [Diacronema lutheri]